MPTTLTVASWNVRQGIAHDRGLIDVVERVGALEADVLALQECWWSESGDSFVPTLAEALGMASHEVMAITSPGRHATRRRVALLSKLPIDDAGSTHLPSHRVVQDSRPIAWIEVGGFRIACTHLHGIHLARKRPAAWRRELDALGAAGSAMDVIAGDFNMWSPAVRRALAGHRSAVRGRTWPSTRPHSQIDHLLHSQRLELVRGEVLADAGSDHRPIRATFHVEGPN